MTRSLYLRLFLCFALVLAMLASSAPAQADTPAVDTVVVANRGSGDISVINTQTLAVQTFDLPGEAEPMYVNHDRRNDQVFVGDRASSSVFVLDDVTFDLIETVSVGDGVFHQWFDRPARQLWVVGDTSRTVSVVNSNTLNVKATIDIPADLVARGGAPHDVFVANQRAFVSILGLDDGTGVVIQYSTRTFEETGRITVGDDPHLFVDGNKLYVASQLGASVSRFNVRTLEPLGAIDVPAAHGIFISPRGEVFVTNITGGGTDAIWNLNKRLTNVRDITDTPVPTPHNLTVDRDRQAWVTHSGAFANQVSVISLRQRSFGDLTTVTVGLNPFGIGLVKS